jgi:hypothetical protein
MSYPGPPPAHPAPPAGCLPQPRPPLDGRPYRQPLDPGPALFARPAAVIGALPAVAGVVAVVILAAVASTGSSG